MSWAYYHRVMGKGRSRIVGERGRKWSSGINVQNKSLNKL